MSIMQRLRNEVPRSRRNMELNPVYWVAKRYYGEIEKAKSEGYTWSQVCNAVKAECISKGEWNNDWGTSHKIAEMYRIVKGQKRTNEVMNSEEVK